MLIVGIESQVYLDIRKEKMLESPSYLPHQLVYLIDENGVVCKGKETITMLDIEKYTYLGMLYGVSVYVENEFDKIFRR